MCAFHPENSSFFGKSFLFLLLLLCYPCSVLSFPNSLLHENKTYFSVVTQTLMNTEDVNKRIDMEILSQAFRADDTRKTKPIHNVDPVFNFPTPQDKLHTSSHAYGIITHTSALIVISVPLMHVFTPIFMTRNNFSSLTLFVTGDRAYVLLKQDYSPQWLPNLSHSYAY